MDRVSRVYDYLLRYCPHDNCLLRLPTNYYLLPTNYYLLLIFAEWKNSPATCSLLRL